MSYYQAETTQFVVGQRVALKVDADRFPFGIIPCGSTGTVAEVHEIDTEGGIITDILYVKMDNQFDWLEEWENCLQIGQCLGCRPEDELEAC